MEKKSNLFTILLTLLFLIIVSTILGLCKLLWWYYSFGVIIGVLTHLLMLIQNKRFFQIQKNDIEKVVYSPKKDSFLWYGLRILVIIILLVGIYFLSKWLYPERLLEITLMVLGGYMTVKVIFILMLLIFKEGR